MNITQTRAALVDVEARLRELADIDDDDMTEEQVAEWDTLLERQADLDAKVADNEAFRERRKAGRERLAARLEQNDGELDAGDVSVEDSADPISDGSVNLNTRSSESPWDRQGIYDNPDDIFARAVTAVEQIHTDDARKSALTDIMERTGQGQIPELVLATTSPEYRKAFADYLASGQMDRNDPAVKFTEPLRRAMSAGTNGEGGFLVPTDIEQSVTLSADGTDAPVYSVGRRVQTTGTTYRVVASPNATWSWDGENTEVSDDQPTLTNTDISTFVAQGFVPFSIASAQSIDNVLGIAQDVLRGGYMDLIGAATTTGTGSSQPVGIVTAMTGATNEVSSATTDVFAVADVYSVHETIAKRHRRNATWMGGIGTINDIRQFATDDGHSLLARLGDGTPGTLLGHPLVENPDMDDTINATQENYILLFGDFSHFVIAEGIGTLVEVIPHVMGTNGRPTGARGVFMMTRFGSDSVLDAAFAMLNVT